MTFYPIPIPLQKAPEEQFHCCHCHSDYSKTDPTYYIAHVQSCRAKHLTALQKARLVSFADQSYPAKQNRQQ